MADDSPPASSETFRDDQLQSLVVGLRYLNGLVLMLVVAVISFHPWVVILVEKAMGILPLLLLVLIFVYVVNPLVAFVLRQVRRIPQMERFSHTRSLVATYLLLLAVVATVLAFLVPKLARELQTLAVNLPSFAQKLQATMIEYRHRYFEALPLPVKDQVTRAVGEIGSMASQVIQGGLHYVGAFSQAVVWVAGALVLVPLIGFYFLKDGSELLDSFVRFAPAGRRARVRRILLEVHKAMQSFLKGQVILCLIIGLLTTAAMALVLPQYCLALGLVAGITEAIPVLGPILGAIPAVIIAFALPEKGGLGLAALVILIYVVIQQLENTILVPRVMGHTLGLHPLSLLLGMMVFGNVFGFWGVVLAAPLVATLKIFVLQYTANREAEPLEAAGGAAPESPASEPFPGNSGEPISAIPPQ
jgi:predicted PurR-regulated permease PerM